MRILARFGLSIFLTVLTVVMPAIAFENPLSSTSVRDAYFLGKRGDGKAAEFLERYIARPPAPKAGEFRIALVEIKTPYILVLERPMRELNYSAPQAEEEFLGKPAALGVHVEINFTSAYKGRLESVPGGFQYRPEVSWRDFQFHLTQKEEIQPKVTRGIPIYCGDGCVAGGWYVDLQYDAEKIESGPMEFDVLMPDGQTAGTTFDLDQLR